MLTEEYTKEPMMPPAMVERVVERLKALADENRVRIILRLKHGHATVGELTDLLKIAQPSVSKHLAILKQAGLVEVHRKGTIAWYSIKDQTIFDLCAIVCDGVTRFAREQHDAMGLSQRDAKDE